MWRSKKFIIIAVLAAVVLVGSIGGVALAQTGDENNNSQAQQGALLDKVCAIYEENTGTAIDAQALQEAFAQAQSEMQDEAMDNYLQKLVEEGKITQEKADQVTEEITSLLRQRHRLASDADDDFNIMSMEELASTLEETSGTMTLLLGAIAGISLLVGGIGVMNIMLVSVLERTREIGIRKALGAREQDIWIQFLVEAALLTFAGGIIGVIIGWLVSYFVNSTGLMTTLVTADIVILAVSVSVGIGLFFGFYPAWNASRLNPIEALRSE
jgi:putative ABC transport system permease protein